MPTQTRFTIAAGPVLVNLTYLAPIEVCIFVRLTKISSEDLYVSCKIGHSIRYPLRTPPLILYPQTAIPMQSNFIQTPLVVSAYYLLYAHATSSSNLELEFLSADDSNIFAWDISPAAKSIYHIAQLTTVKTLTENNDMSEDGFLILAYTAVIKFNDYFDAEQPLIEFSSA